MVEPPSVEDASPDRPATIRDGRVGRDHLYTRRRSVGTLGIGMDQSGVANIRYGSNGQDTKVSAEDTAAIRTTEDLAAIANSDRVVYAKDVVLNKILSTGKYRRR